MTSGRFLFSLASVGLCVALVQSANAAIIITTNMNGADAELREDVNHQLPDLGGVPQGSNRGTQTEIATRIGNTQSSTFYMKFDISNLTPAKLAGKKVNLQLHVHTANLNESRLTSYAQNDVLPRYEYEQVRMNFAVRGLDPNMVDGLANPNNHNANQVYEWGENTITYFNAPGISPDSPDGSSAQTLGELDYNSDAQLLGDWYWPRAQPANHLAVGEPLLYGDSNGNLKQLVLDALAAGKSSVTVMIAHNLPNAVSTPSSFLGFNYIAIPKDRTQLNNDNSYDPDGGGAGPVTGSPYSCLHSTVCPLGTLGSNPFTGPGAGRFSPKLIVWVPEPSSMLLLALGSVASLALVRRRRK